MKILLTAINAKYIHSNLAVYSLRTAAGAYAPLVELAEYTVNQRTEEIFRSIYEKKPQLLFFSCYIWNREPVLELAGDLHKVLPELTVWAGGPEVSYNAEEFLAAHPQIDGIMRGEGEDTFRRLLEYYTDGIGTLAEIPGITYRTGGPEGCNAIGKERVTSGITCRAGGPEDCNAIGKERVASGVTCRAGESEGCPGTAAPDGPAAGGIRSNPAAPLSETLDGLPFVYERPEEFAHRILYYESSRGCPFSCSYCLSSIERTVRFRSLALVERELGVFLAHGVPQVKFVDRTFNCNHGRTLRLWRFLKEHDNGITNFHFEISADLLNEEELALLAELRPGLVQLEIGVQTTNPRTLAAIHRTAGFEEIAWRVERISKAGNVHQHLDLIAGLPYEDFESFGRSFDAVYRLHPQELQLGFLKVLKGSEMHRRAGEYGIAYRSTPPYEVLETRWITCGELLRLKEIEEMLEIYYNSGQFRNTMAALEQMFERPFALYAALADYDRSVREPGTQLSRRQRFEALRGFIREQTGKQERRFDELLTLDCYLRENAKTRPAWAAEPGPYRERIAEFYRQEERDRKYLPDYRDLTWKQMMRVTHLERFTCVPGAETGKEQWMLFDYSRRNALTRDAAVYVVDVP